MTRPFVYIDPDTGPTEDQAAFIAGARAQAGPVLTDQQIMSLYPIHRLWPLYRVPGLVGSTLDHRGFRPFGHGVAVHLKHAQLATTDLDELTRLVIFAHESCARIGIGVTDGFATMKITVHPRRPGIRSNIEGHPSPDDLVSRALDGAA